MKIKDTNAPKTQMPTACDSHANSYYYAAKKKKNKRIQRPNLPLW